MSSDLTCPACGASSWEASEIYGAGTRYYTVTDGAWTPTGDSAEPGETDYTCTKCGHVVDPESDLYARLDAIPGL